jgi:hypothetical protein
LGELNKTKFGGTSNWMRKSECEKTTLYECLGRGHHQRSCRRYALTRHCAWSMDCGLVLCLLV